jgi:signal transduction histidine kinase
MSSPLPEHALDVAVGGFVALNLGLMATFPHAAAVLLHISWLAVILLYGLRSWGYVSTNAIPTLLAAGSGALLWQLADAGEIDMEEIGEGPLMAGIFLVTTWQVRRQQKAADGERRQRHLELALARRVRHDLRSPLTVARGYLELIQLRSTDPSIREDARTAISALDRLTAIVTSPEAGAPDGSDSSVRTSGPR